jgi:pyrimidine-specific ribonucleoside hydrolase
MTRVPVVDVTDLYHPYQDADDNLDLLLAYGLPEVDLLGVVLDCHQSFREPIAPVESEPGLWADPTGPRDPGFIPVMQLNYIFDRAVPCAVGPFTRMRALDDSMWDAPTFQQQGIELLLRLLKESPEPVHVVAQGSGRPLAVAYNRAPELFHRKVARLHLCMGATSPSFLEWNIALDVHAAVCLLRSDLPIALYPPATGGSPFEMECHNCYWYLETLEWVVHLHPKLKRYLDFVYSRAQRVDFLRAMEEDFPVGTNAERYAQGHHLWTTAMWMEVTGRRLALTGEAHRLLLPDEASANANILPHALRPCELEVAADGRFTFQLVEEGRHLIYDRIEPTANAQALNEAFPALCRSFTPEAKGRAVTFQETCYDTRSGT